MVAGRGRAPGTGSAPPGLEILMNWSRRVECWSWYQSPRTTVYSASYEWASFSGWMTSGARRPSTYWPCEVVSGRKRRKKKGGDIRRRARGPSKSPTGRIRSQERRSQRCRRGGYRCGTEGGSRGVSDAYMRGTHHWETPTAPSIQEVELKYMPWWWRLVGSLRELCACTRRVSFVDTSTGGGLHDERGVSEAEREDEGGTHGQVPLTPMTCRSKRPSGLAFST